jgi:hypothetical protein
MTKDMQTCIENCFECHSTCIKTAGHCLKMGGAHAGVEHQRSLSDCIESCATSAHFMLHMSPFHSRYCGLCAEVCAACADSCEKLAKGDEVMLHCVEICRKCEASCRAMA